MRKPRDKEHALEKAKILGDLKEILDISPAQKEKTEKVIEKLKKFAETGEWNEKEK